MAGETKVEFDILAHDKASDKLDKVARKFKQVGDEADKVGEHTDGIDRLTAKFKKSGDDSAKGFGANMKRWFKGDGAGLFSELGKSGGTVFGSGLLGALKTPILGPALIAGLGAAVAVAAPAVGAIAASGIVAGFGAGIAGLGIVFAAKSAAVKSKWKSTLSGMGADMQLLSAPFQSTLINIAGYAQRTFDKFSPALGKSFSKMAPMVDKFVDGAARSLEQLIPAIGPITDAFGAVLKSLGPALQSAVGSLAKGMTDLALSVERNPDGLADMVKGLGDFAGVALRLVTILNNVNGSFSTLTGGTSLVEVVMEGLKATMAPLMVLFAGLGKAIDLVNAATGRTGKNVEGAGAAMSNAANDTVKLAQGYQKTGEQATHAVAPLQTVTDALTRQKLGFTSTIAAMGQWADNAIASSDASIALERAIDDASASVKENGRTLDISTAKGQANQSSLNRLATAAKVQMAAMDAAGDSNVKVAATGEKSRAAFIRLATQMGKTVPEAKKMADSMIKIPNVSRQAKLTADKKDLDTKLASVKRQLADKSLTATKRAKLEADKKQIEAAIAKVKRDLASLPRSRTVTLTSRFITERIIRTQTTSGGGHAPGFAGGGLIPGQPSSVDNHLRPMATGEFVVQASQVPRNRALLEAINSGRRPAQFASSAGGGGGGGTVNLMFQSDGTPYMEFLIKEFRKYIRVQGGDVQAVLGRG